MSVLKCGSENPGRTLRSRFVYCVLRLQRDCRLPHHHRPPSHHEQRCSLIFPFLLTVSLHYQYQNEPDLKNCIGQSRAHFNITRLTCSLAHELFVAVDMIQRVDCFPGLLSCELIKPSD